MATYVTLVKFTEEGVKKAKDTGKRATDFKAAAKKLGIEVREQFWCLGAYDGVIVFDAADDETATAAMLSLSSQDYVTTQTMRAFTAAEMSKILGRVTYLRCVVATGPETVCRRTIARWPRSSSIGRETRGHRPGPFPCVHRARRLRPPRTPT